MENKKQAIHKISRWEEGDNNEQCHEQRSQLSSHRSIIERLLRSTWCDSEPPPERSHQLRAGQTPRVLQLSPNYNPRKIGLAIFSSFPLDLSGYLGISDCPSRVSVTSVRIQQRGPTSPHLESVEVKGAGILGWECNGNFNHTEEQKRKSIHLNGEMKTWRKRSNSPASVRIWQTLESRNEV